MKKLLFIIAAAGFAASCNTATNNAGNMQAEANKMKFQRFYDEVLNAHNPALIDSFCTSDFVDHNPDQGHSGIGIEALKANLTEFFGAYPDMNVKTNFMIAQGDTVMAHITITGTNSGAMGNMPATNKQMNIDGIDVIVLKDGKATQRWGFFDTMKMMMQLGMMQAPGTMPESAENK